MPKPRPLVPHAPMTWIKITRLECAGHVVWNMFIASKANVIIKVAQDVAEVPKLYFNSVHRFCLFALSYDYAANWSIFSMLKDCSGRGGDSMLFKFLYSFTKGISVCTRQQVIRCIADSLVNNIFLSLIFRYFEKLVYHAV